MKKLNKEQWEDVLMNPREDPEKLSFDELHNNSEDLDSDKVILDNPEVTFDELYNTENFPLDIEGEENDDRDNDI
jgi:hypothetical protein